MTKVTTENYYDAAAALYWYCRDYNGGPSSELYHILSIIEYQPSMTEVPPNDSDKPNDFYIELVSGRDATDLFHDINLQSLLVEILPKLTTAQRDWLQVLERMTTPIKTAEVERE
jgi:hypothetical protein